MKPAHDPVTGDRGATLSGSYSTQSHLLCLGQNETQGLRIIGIQMTVIINVQLQGRGTVWKGQEHSSARLPKRVKYRHRVARRDVVYTTRKQAKPGKITEADSIQSEASLMDWII